MRRFHALLTLPAMLALLVGGAAMPVGAANPPGNNGTVKVDAKVFDVLPDNEPHPQCVFQVDFYGFDAGSLFATAAFTVISPTVATDTTVFTSPPVAIGEDDNSGGGSVVGIDQQVTFDLNAQLAAYMTSKAGAHVRLTVHADGATNADTKSKVFWVTGCVQPPTDTDHDGVPDTRDNCPTVANPDQLQTYGDPALGDACEDRPNDN